MAHGVVECPVGGDSAASANTSFFGPLTRICGTLCLMQNFRISRAAQLLGVSDDTVRRWIDQGLLPTTDAVPAEIPGDALAARAVALAEEAQESNHALSSARNRFVGIVTRVQIDGVMAQVDLQSGPHRVVSLMSAEAARELQLEVGSLATASVKATNVVVEVPKG